MARSAAPGVSVPGQGLLILQGEAESSSSRKGGHDVMLTDFENMAPYQYHEKIYLMQIFWFLQ